MARVATFRHQPTERKRYVVDLSDWMSSTTEFVDTVEVNVEVRKTYPEGTVLTPTLLCDEITIQPNSQEFSFFASLGADGIEYWAEILITTTLGQAKEIEVMFIVNDD